MQSLFLPIKLRSNFAGVVSHHVSGEFFFSSTPDVVAVVLGGGEGLPAFFAPFVDNVSLFDQQVLHYVDGGNSPVVKVSLSVSASTGSGAGAGKVQAAFTSDPQRVTLTGYLLDCAASPCATIAR